MERVREVEEEENDDVDDVETEDGREKRKFGIGGKDNFPEEETEEGISNDTMVGAFTAMIP